MVVNPYRSQESRPRVIGVTELCQPTTNRHHNGKSPWFSTRLIIVVIFCCVAVVSYIFHVHHSVEIEQDSGLNPKKLLLRGSTINKLLSSTQSETSSDLQEINQNNQHDTIDLQEPIKLQLHDSNRRDISITRTTSPTFQPTVTATVSPTVPPTAVPSVPPTIAPTIHLTAPPTPVPTTQPTLSPTNSPTTAPTVSPTIPTPTTKRVTAPKITLTGMERDIQHDQHHANLISDSNAKSNEGGTNSARQFIIDVSKIPATSAENGPMTKREETSKALVSEVEHDLSDHNSHAKEALLGMVHSKSIDSSLETIKEPPNEPLNEIVEESRGHQYHHDSKIIPLHIPDHAKPTPVDEIHKVTEHMETPTAPVEPLSPPVDVQSIGGPPITGFDIPALSDKLKTKSQLESASKKENTNPNKIDYCESQVDPFEGQPVESFVPPKGASFENVLEWKKSVKEMLKTISRLQIGGDPLRKRIQEEVDKLKILRFKTFCMFA